MLHSLKAHRISECPFARQDGLPLQIRIHHCDDGLIVGEVLYDARHIDQPRYLGCMLSSVTAYEFERPIACSSHSQGR